MRKRIFAAVLAAAMIVSLCACGNGSGDTQQPSGDNTPATPPTITSLASFDDFKIILKDEKYEVKDEDVVDYFVSMLCTQGAGLIEVKDRDIVQKGDVVQFDYTGYLNDKAFDGGAAENQIIDVDKNQTFDEKTGEYGSTFIDKFSDGLIGAEKTGLLEDKKPVKHNVTFPNNYSNSSLAGKETTFEFTVDRIYVKATPDNVTDEYVKRYMEKQGFTTVEALLTDCRERLISKAVIDYTIANSKVDISGDYLQERLTIYENHLVEAYGLQSIEEYAAKIGYSIDSIRPYWLAEIKSCVITEVVLVEMMKSKDVKEDDSLLQEYLDDVLNASSSSADEDDYFAYVGCGNVEKGRERLSNELTIAEYILEKYRASQSVTE